MDWIRGYQFLVVALLVGIGFGVLGKAVLGALNVQLAGLAVQAFFAVCFVVGVGVAFGLYAWYAGYREGQSSNP